MWKLKVSTQFVPYKVLKVNGYFSVVHQAQREKMHSTHCLSSLNVGR